MKKRMSLYEEQYLEMIRIVREAKERLIAATDKVIVKQGVINLYPEGPDKKHAVKDCEEAKYNLICAIGEYDARRQESINYAKTYEKELGGVYTNRFLTSHQLIEFAYEQWHKK